MRRSTNANMAACIVVFFCLLTSVDSFVVPARGMSRAHNGLMNSSCSRSSRVSAGTSASAAPSLAQPRTSSSIQRGRGMRGVVEGIRGGKSGSAVGAVSASAVDDAVNVGGEVVDVLGNNRGILNDEQRAMAATLLELGQQHLFEGWPEVGTEDDGKRKLMDQSIGLDAKYPGGLSAYVAKARQLLKEASEGVNPFEGFTPELADGERLEFGTEEFNDMEAKGLEAAAKTAFVLVAGGLGERLGYDGIKLALPVEVTTRQRYLELYCKHILALQAKCRRFPGAAADLTLPLVIMTSEDTDAKTRELVEKEGRYGMAEGQIVMVMQDKVPALGDSSAGLVLSDPFTLETKPHGHGDVHHLLLRDGVAEKLKEQGFEWLFFFQDTNALVLNSLLPALGVSSSKGYHMNSICVPRKAKEAAGAITALTKDDGTSLIINVEYNQLDPILRATVSPEGDVNDPATGLSPFPGNTNNLVFMLEPYLKVLQGEDEGVVVEFVNPKYKAGSRTEFKKPTRLECMMQDFPKLMSKEMGDSAKIGFTSFEKWLTFSPAKNDLESAAAAAADGVPPGTASSAESEFYAQAARRLQMAAGCELGEPEAVEFAGVPLSMGPRVVLQPSFATTTEDLRKKTGPGVKVSSRSTLVLEGEGLHLEGLELDGALVIKAAPGARVTVRGLKVSNEGWAMVPLPEDLSQIIEEDRVRGYLIEKKATRVIEIKEPGDWIVGVDGEAAQQVAE
ncbi:unnamed protein product [Pylaiella littoralis]